MAVLIDTDVLIDWEREETASTLDALVGDVPGASMVPVPKPRINASSRAGNTTNLTVGHQPLAGGVLNGGGCTLAVTGFKVYQQSVPRNAPAPSSAISRRTNSGWTLLGPAAAPGGDVSGQVTCGVDSDVYLMTTVVLDGNVELQQGSSNSLKVQCGPTLANPTDEGNDFRFTAQLVGIAYPAGQQQRIIVMLAHLSDRQVGRDFPARLVMHRPHDFVGIERGEPHRRSHRQQYRARPEQLAFLEPVGRHDQHRRVGNLRHD